MSDDLRSDESVDLDGDDEIKLSEPIFKAIKFLTNALNILD